MKSQLQREDNGTILLTISLPWEEIVKTETLLMEEAVQSAQLPGFRKGKAPKKLVEEKIDKTKLSEDVLKKLIPSAYVKAVEEHKLKPIVNPQIHIEKIERNTPWQFTAKTCEMPEIKLGDYKDKVKSLTAAQKIVIPGKEEKKEEVKFEEIMKVVVESVQLQVPQLLIDSEAERLLANTLDEVKRLGLTLDQYIQATGRTPETLRKEYEEKAKTDITIEFALQKIAEEEKISVEPNEIEEAIRQAKDEKEKANLEQNRYLLAGILRQQKTLDFLRHL